MKAPSWTNGEKLILLENVKTFDDIVKKKFSVHIDERTKGKGVGLAEDSTNIFLLMYSSSNSEGGIVLTCGYLGVHCCDWLKLIYIVVG